MNPTQSSIHLVSTKCCCTHKIVVGTKGFLLFVILQESVGDARLPLFLSILWFYNCYCKYSLYNWLNMFLVYICNIIGLEYWENKKISLFSPLYNWSHKEHIQIKMKFQAYFLLERLHLLSAYDIKRNFNWFFYRKSLLHLLLLKIVIT